MTQTTTRLNPMQQVLPKELLQVANKLMEVGQMEWYWKDCPVPKRPLGRIRNEVARQVATFAVPLLGLAWAYLTYGLKGLLFALPAAWLVGYMLDKNLTKAIKARQAHDNEIDRGRYKAVMWLSEQTGLRPEEITLDIIRKMDFDFLQLKRAEDEAKAKADAAAAAQKAARRGNRRDRNYDGDDNTRRTGSRRRYDDDTYLSTAPYVNPTTGLPMIPGTAIDVQGNAFATGGMM